ncbi:MAG: phosphoribosylformylglycinamidine synthase subunit PurL [Endomicrobiales bacterium]|nr:phosphoribosylformylglycinamidine synthase subunit PurL [Endomicrobiales bacterium]
METKEIRLNGLKDDELLKISRDNVLSLSVVEMRVVQKYFEDLGRDPTDAELETIAQTWSEHCKHKTLTGVIEYTETADSAERIADSNGRNKDFESNYTLNAIRYTPNKKGKCVKRKIYNNLLKETIFEATRKLNKPWCISVFKDNAGVIEFDDENGIAFKVETHNHPSALEPYGGAATGIGGVIRDILGVGLGAKPLANTDVFCFGDPHLDWKKLPEGMLHPKRIAKGVVSGVRDYGNRMGIPTVNGAVWFDDGFVSNPLVYCGTMGIIPREKAFKKVEPGDLVLVVGGRTGRDGIHGATFSSTKLDQETDVSAVQIGNPIVEKKMMDTLLRARDKGFYRAVTDCGAGGLSSAVGELGEETGVKVNLEKVPLKYEGLKPWEIWLSEAQERMVLAVPPENRDKISKVFESENVEATFIGEFTDDKKLTVMYNREIVAELDMEFLHGGVPKVSNAAEWRVTEEKKVKVQNKSDYTKDLESLLGSLNICSREWIIRQYDHEVQGHTVVKPMQGPDIVNQGPGDAAVIWPYTAEASGKGQGSSNYKGITLSCGLNPEYGKIDAYWMAASAIDEAIRNAVCVGADPEKIALLDNFCWGNPYKKEILGSLVRAAEACHDMALKYGAPFISGKDSLHNEYAVGNRHYSIPGTLLISAIGIVNDIRKTVTMCLKKPGNLVYVIGMTRNELGGSQFLKLGKKTGGVVPKVYPETAFRQMKALSRAISSGLVEACHDCSEGGLAVALAEMAFAGNRGAEIDLSRVPSQEKMSDAEMLFSESNSRFIVEVSAENSAEFEKTMTAGADMAVIGRVASKREITVKGSKGRRVIKGSNDAFRKSWKRTLAW